jgi:hypothetical protein
MLAVHSMSVLLVAASSMAWAQLVIENPGHLDMPEQQAQVLFLTTTGCWNRNFILPALWKMLFA